MLWEQGSLPGRSGAALLPDENAAIGKVRVYRRIQGIANPSARGTGIADKKYARRGQMCTALRKLPIIQQPGNAHEMERSSSLWLQVTGPLPVRNTRKVILEIKNSEEKCHDSAQAQIDRFHRIVVALN